MRLLAQSIKVWESPLERFFRVIDHRVVVGISLNVISA